MIDCNILLNIEIFQRVIVYKPAGLLPSLLVIISRVIQGKLTTPGLLLLTLIFPNHCFVLFLDCHSSIKADLFFVSLECLELTMSFLIGQSILNNTTQRC